MYLLPFQTAALLVLLFSFSCSFFSFGMAASSADLPIGDLIRGWSLVHKVAGMAGARECDKLTEVIKVMVAAEARQLVLEAKGRPTLCSYSNDGTPMRILKRVVTEGVGGRVVRYGGSGHELLVQRAIFRTRSSTGEWLTAMNMRDPLPLVHGKGGDAIFSAGVEFLQTLRQMGHQGIAVQHYVFDRALHTPLVRRFKQHHAQLALARAGSAISTGAKALWDPALLEWVVDTACANRDVHNALKWSMFEPMANAQLMKVVFIVVESIRNGFSLIEDELGRWLVGVVRWVEEEDLVPTVVAVALWSALGGDTRVGGPLGRPRVALAEWQIASEPEAQREASCMDRHRQFHSPLSQVYQI